MKQKEFEGMLLDATGLRGKGVRAMTFHFEIDQPPILMVQFTKPLAENAMGKLFEEYELTLIPKKGEKAA